MSAPQDLIGVRYGRLVAIRSIGSSIHKRRIWLCQCDCGNEVQVLANSLRTGRTVSCKCYTKELTSKAFKKHNGSNSTEYQSWLGMKNRCYNSKQKQWKDYGGRGIKVCGKWLNDFSAFVSDMGNKPSCNYSIERINNSKGYEPFNCKWATHDEQANNRRSNRLVSVKNETLTIAQWCKALNIKSHVIYDSKLSAEDKIEELITNNKSPEGFDSQGLLDALSKLK